MNKSIILIALMLAISYSLTINHLRRGQNKGQQGQNNWEQNHSSCSQDQFYSRSTKACQACSVIPNSDGTSLKKGCNCAQNYFWDHQDQTCTQCPTQGCPEPHQRGEGRKERKNGQGTPSKCADSQFYDWTSKSCESCSTIKDSNGTSGQRGGCSCNENYFWNHKEQNCTQCSAQGCPQPHKNKGVKKNQKTHQSQRVLPKCEDNFFYRSQNHECIPCNEVDNSDGTATNQSCNCDDNYEWDFFTYQCLSCPEEGCYNAN